MKKTIFHLISLFLCLSFLLSSCTLIAGFMTDESDSNQNSSNKVDDQTDDKLDDNTNDVTGDKTDDSTSDKTDGAEDDKKDDTTDDSDNVPTISANVPERFKSAYTIDRAKLESAAAAATAKLLERYAEGGSMSPDTCSIDYQYKYGANNNWTAGMYTGAYLMAYQLTGDERFANIVEEHLDTFVYRVENRVGMGDHDVGFAFVPSCVGAYKILGSERAKEAALNAVDYYYDTGYSKEGKFIIRAFSWNNFDGFRTMIDSQMNASLFFWAGEHLDNQEYSSAGENHTLTTVDLIVRDDGSTYHHYQFDPETAEPLYGLTWQGLADESCWSRGQSWGVYGFSIAYSYTQNQEILDAQRDATYYMLNHLPEDLIPYWDYTYTSGDQPRDASAAAIAVCGMLDMAEMLPEGSEQRIIYESAAAQIMEALIDNYTGDIGVEYDGLIHGVTHALPQKRGIEECAPYADYFFMEALARFLKDDFIRPW